MEVLPLVSRNYFVHGLKYRRRKFRGNTFFERWKFWTINNSKTQVAIVNFLSQWLKSVEEFLFTPCQWYINSELFSCALSRERRIIATNMSSTGASSSRASAYYIGTQSLDHNISQRTGIKSWFGSTGTYIYMYIMLHNVCR